MRSNPACNVARSSISRSLSVLRRFTCPSQVLGKFLVADGATLFEKRFDVLENKCVALDRCRVMCFFVPKPAPNALSLSWCG